MPTLKLLTRINAPAEICFDLSRSIDLHTISTQHTGERAIAGTTQGLIGPGEFVTWRAKHFRIWQQLTSKITAYERPVFFADEMVKGAFKSFRHEHHFEQHGSDTIMLDIFVYTSPLGFLGRLADFCFLKGYMEQLLKQRNQVIKAYAETGKWKEIINMN
ncbi:SRPBCC family protein [Pontibacter ruber]|uniref:Cell division protein n=1 Tax=Pontibacter ruber TaxID=1343895 RepID=A0ABW5D1F4_9BACT|nr:SRPBCC family protein [Pontibacter ruber]